MNKYLDLRGSSWEDNRDELLDIVDYWDLESSCKVIGFRILKLNKHGQINDINTLENSMGSCILYR